MLHSSYLPAKLLSLSRSSPKTLRLPEPEETEKLLAAMKPGAHGLTFLPLLARERGPAGWADRRKARWRGSR